MQTYGIRSKTMTTLKIQETTKVNTSGNLSFYCYVTLKDSEQIIIDIQEKEWSGGTYQLTGVTKKARLEQICYQSGCEDTPNVYLYSLEVRGFRKDKGLRYRTDRVYSPDQSVIDQIPAEYHNYARVAFVNKVAELQQQLTTMTNGGIQIGNK